jgi:hypothetical protein
MEDKNMKRYFTIIAAVLSLLAFSACKKDFLTENWLTTFMPEACWWITMDSRA